MNYWIDIVFCKVYRSEKKPKCHQMVMGPYDSFEKLKSFHLFYMREDVNRIQKKINFLNKMRLKDIEYIFPEDE